jgi:hypothetical protein
MGDPLTDVSRQRIVFIFKDRNVGEYIRTFRPVKMGKIVAYILLGFFFLGGGGGTIYV